ncbi:MULTISPECIES: hypothetical protein [Paenibacillus]|jgi:hypothetical protein|uniref:Uncharacterized protein n=1 Tax=Paenibacillus azoreducens TaxID=116718 RepID=A0A919YGQ3_9BACL|nr:MULTISPECIES: hypothetical protein [Paenibacillus]MBE9916786.1 hypothetical protein [Paenibacillus donghaensis]GIO48890.1 hypothetical protein J34TS1_36550 [Paenibacillus azoreducens]
MWTTLLWILMAYAFAVAAVHAFHIWQKRKDFRRIHYILVTSNHEHQIEWYIRALGLYALITGTNIRLTVVDIDSADDTLGIIERLGRYGNLELSVTTDYSILNHAEHSDIRMIDLRNPHEAGQIPYV